MKKLSFSIAIFFGATSFLFSQIEKGTVLLGGNAGIQFKSSKQQNSDVRTTEFIFSASPYAMFSVIQQLALGGQLSYAYSSRKEKTLTGVYSDATNIFTIGPALRGNIFIGGKTYFFIHASPSFGVGVNRDPTDRNDVYTSTSLITWRIGPGFSIFTTKNMAVELGFYYDGMKDILAIKQNKAVLSKRSPVFTHGLTVAIGLQFYAHKKVKSPVQNH